MKIYLIRHGESTSDVKERYDEDYDDNLTKKGIKEAGVIAKKLSNSNIEIIFTSPKIRALQTTKILKSELNCKTMVLDDLSEQDIYGAYPELSKDQPEEEYRRLGEILADQDEMIEGVETYSHFKKRVVKSFSELIRQDFNVIAIVTHGGPIRIIFREILKLGEFKKIGNASIILLEKNKSLLRVIKIDGAALASQPPAPQPTHFDKKYFHQRSMVP